MSATEAQFGLGLKFEFYFEPTMEFALRIELESGIKFECARAQKLSESDLTSGPEVTSKVVQK